MKVSYNWLKEYIDLEGITPEQLADKLTHAGTEVEGLERIASGSDLTIGEVLSCEKHPDSDHLSVCTVDIKTEVLMIVCGAPNVAKGQKVMVAKVGCVLPELTIKQANVRGVDSCGMICSLSEVGYNKKYLTAEQLTGIEVLSTDAPVGEEPLAYLGINDTVLDMKPTPNRKDCLAMWNIAKEIQAIIKRPSSLPEYKCNHSEASTKLIVKSDTAKCPLFIGKVINKLVVKESPAWLKEFLHAAGIKSINNVVDISNYVMLETGQPLHFYDASKIKNQEITVKDGICAKYTALDGVEYELCAEDLIITNDNQPIGIAGIMGGDDSKIDETTKGIIIESAVFDAVKIRNTARRLGLQTEAVQRFAKGLEPLASIKAMNRAVELLIKLAEATDIEETVTFGSLNYQPTKVTETLTHLNQLLGTEFTMDQFVAELTALDFEPVVAGDEVVSTIPSYRTDILIREDIDEEIIRLIGYDSLKTSLPESQSAGQLTRRQAVRRTTKEILRASGLSEIITYTLVGEKALDIQAIGIDNVLEIAAPLSEQRRYIRNSLMYSMLESVSYNKARKATNLNLFELSNVYGKNQYEEHLGLVVSDSLQASKIKNIEVKADFYVLKGIVLTWLEKFGFSGTRIKIVENAIDTDNFHPYQSAVLYLGKEVLGIIGKVHPNIVSELDLPEVYYAELSIDVLLNNKASGVKFKALDRYPSVNRDVALVVAEAVKAADIIRTITSSSKLVKHAEIFDIYTGEHVEKGNKSIALSIEYQAFDHTLTEQEILEIHQKILDNLKNKCNANLRS